MSEVSFKTSRALAEYPKEAKLKTGQKIVVRPLVKEDNDALLAFFRALPREDREKLKDDVTKPEVISHWTDNIDYESVIAILAFCDDKIIGDATLHRTTFGWSTHVGEIRIVTSQEFRAQGLGRLLLRELFFIALVLQLDKLIAQMPEEQAAARKVFRTLGFEQEAVLKNQIKDLEGRPHNLVIMSQEVIAFWKKIQDSIADTLADHSGS